MKRANKDNLNPVSTADDLLDDDLDVDADDADDCLDDDDPD